MIALRALGAPLALRRLCADSDQRSASAAMRLGATLALAGLCACAGNPESPNAGDAAHVAGPAWAGTIEERGGVLRVDNPGEPLWPGPPGARLSFELEAEFGGPDAAFSNIAGAVVDRDNVLHVFDAGAGQLVALDADGTVHHRVGSPGTDTGQFAGVRGIAYDGVDTVYVANQNGTRLDAWSIGGRLSRSLPIATFGVDNIFMGGFLSPRRLALIVNQSQNMAANDYLIVDPGDTPATVDRFRLGAEPMIPTPPSVVLQLSHTFHDGTIIVGTWERYALRTFDARGRLARRVTRPVDYLRRPGFALRGEGYLSIALGGLAAPIVLDNGYWLVLASWPTNVGNANAFAELPAAARPTIAWASSLDLFDAEGRFLHSVEYPGRQSPDIGRPWAVGPDGALYTVVAQPFPSVRRYRVVIDFP